MVSYRPGRNRRTSVLPFPITLLRLLGTSNILLNFDALLHPNCNALREGFGHLASWGPHQPCESHWIFTSGPGKKTLHTFRQNFWSPIFQHSSIFFKVTEFTECHYFGYKSLETAPLEVLSDSETTPNRFYVEFRPR